MRLETRINGCPIQVRQASCVVLSRGFGYSPDPLCPMRAALPDDILKEAVPGNIRRAEHFTAFLARFVEYLKTRMRVLHVVAETPASFLQHLKELTFIEKKPLR